MTINSSDATNKAIKQGGFTSGIPIGKPIPINPFDKPANKPNKSGYGNPLQQSKTVRTNNGQNSSSKRS